MEILELKSTISEIKISLDGLNRRSQMSEERVNELEDGSIEIIQSEEWRGKKTEPNDNIKLSNMHNWNLERRGEHTAEKYLKK